MKYFTNAFFIIAVFFAMTSLVNAKDDDIIWLEYPNDGAVLGQGYDLLNGRVTLGRCVDFVPIQDPSQIITYKFEEVNSTTEVMSKTRISASGSMKMAIIKASARLSFLSEENFSLSTSKFLLTARVTNSALFAAPSVGFKKGANIAQITAAGAVQASTEQLKKHVVSSRIEPRNGGPEVFKDVKLCGQGYVAAIVSGAAVDAFLTMSKSNADSLADIKGGLEADIASVFKVSGSFEQQQSSKEIQDSTSISVYRYGGATGNIAYDLPALKQSLQSLVTDAASQPKPIRIGVVPYNRISTDLVRTINADDYSQAISAYFLAKDVMDKTGEALTVLGEVPLQPDKARVAGGRPIYYTKELRDYDKLFSKAQEHAARISTLLAYCRDASAETNDAQMDNPQVEEVLAELFGAGEEQPLFGDRNGNAQARIQLKAAQNVQIDDAATLENIYESNLSVLQSSLPNKDDPKYVEKIKNRNKACKAPIDPDTGEGSYLSISGLYSVQLLKEEMMVRPLYWAEISQRYRERIAVELKKAATSAGIKVSELSSNQIAAASQNELVEFHTLYRASQYRRNLCESDLAHPICFTDTGWSEGTNPDFDSIEFDAQQLLVEVGTAL